MLYIYITFYLGWFWGGKCDENPKRYTRFERDGIINSLRSRPSAARSARINTFIMLQLANPAYKACLKELFDDSIKANACSSQIVQF